MISELLESIRKNPKKFLGARKGSEFEEIISVFIKISLGFTRIMRSDLSKEEWAQIKSHISKKLEDKFIDIPRLELKNTFIYQPYGSQEFPDFLIFTNKKIVPLEIKFSSGRQSKPVWNSNVPRSNAFYIFGSYRLQDITFFSGDNIISKKHRTALYKFFEDIKKIQEEIRKDMPKLDETNRGFTPYIRSAFDQAKHKPEVELNFFLNPDRETTELSALEKIKGLD